jgi:hypothetical protein
MSEDVLDYVWGILATTTESVYTQMQTLQNTNEQKYSNIKPVNSYNK